MNTINTGQFVSPESTGHDQLFGRENEKTLLAEMLDVVCCGRTALCFVSGYAGSGKTSLVKQLKPEVEKRKGLFVSGKFDQYHKDIPYSAFIEILRNLARQLLMKNETELSSWRKKITKALYPNSRIIIDLVPELEYITGPQNKAPDIDPVNAENRFKHCFGEFFKILADGHTPFVIFLDDMHWADPASLKIIIHLIRTDPAPGLYIAGAYRDNEVNDTHILVRMIDEILGSDILFRNISLPPLKQEDIDHIIESATGKDERILKKLSGIVYRKTGGNPFFTRRFLGALKSNGHLVMYGNRKWRLDEKAILAMPAAENVTALLAGIIHELDPLHQRILSAASLIGSTFSAELTGKILDMATQEVTRELVKMTRQDLLIIKDAGIFSFAHDRIQEAANSIMDEKTRALLHYRAGSILSRVSGNDNSITDIFAVTDHFNEARSLIRSDKEILVLVSLNQDAGLRAKSNVAYDSAVRYFRTAITLLDSLHETASEDMLYFSRWNYAECLYLNGKFTESESAVNDAMQYAVTAMGKAELYNILIMMKTMELKYAEAIEYGITAMRLFGLEFSLDPDIQAKQITEEKSAVDRCLEKASVDTITGLPACERDDIRLLIKLLRNIAAPCYFNGDRSSSMLVILKMNSISFKHGIVPESITGFGAYGQMICSSFGEYRTGEILGRSSFILSKKFGNLSLICETGMRYGSAIRYWNSHLRESLPYLNEALNTGLKAGEYVYAAMAAGNLVLNTISLGEPLQKTLQFYDGEFGFFRKINDQLTVNIFLCLKKAYSGLTGEDIDAPLTGGTDKDKFLEDMSRLPALLPFLLYCINKSLVLYIYGNYTGALEYNLKAEPISVFIYTIYHEIDILFYKSLIMCALYHNSKENSQKDYNLQITEMLVKLKAYAEQCPDNFLHRYLLLKAEYIRITGDILYTMKLYDRAIEAAGRNGYRQFEAISCERAALFWEENGKPDFAGLYLRRAYDCYRDWGALRKLEQLRNRYSEIFHDRESSGDELNSSEILSMLKTFNSLTHLDKTGDIVKKFSRIILDSTGTESFILFIEKGGRKFFIKAWINPDEEIPDLKTMVSDEDLKDNTDELPVEIIRYVKRTDEQVLTEEPGVESEFSGTPYIKKHRPLSVMCTRTGDPGDCVIFYLENRRKNGIFTGINQKKLEMLGWHAAMCLENALYRTGRWHTQKDSTFVFRSGGEIIKIPCGLIIYVSSRGRHSVVHTADSVMDTPMYLGDIEKSLPAGLFRRIHNQYVVNVQYIRRVRNEGSGRYSVYLNDEEDTWLPVGRKYNGGIMEKIPRPGATKYLS